VNVNRHMAAVHRSGPVESVDRFERHGISGSLGVPKYSDMPLMPIWDIEDRSTWMVTCQRCNGTSSNSIAAIVQASTTDRSITGSSLHRHVKMRIVMVSPIRVCDQRRVCDMSMLVFGLIANVAVAQETARTCHVVLETASHPDRRRDQN
jgi:hypothetical protein